VIWPQPIIISVRTSYDIKAIAGADRRASILIAARPTDLSDLGRRVAVFIIVYQDMISNRVGSGHVWPLQVGRVESVKSGP
jgi:hypothetical protein